MENDEFTLYDLKVEVTRSEKPFVCSHREGDAFLVQGENLVFPEGGAFSLYTLSALLPLLPAKQRPLQDADWMGTDDIIACPDPNCGARFKITRVGTRTFRPRTRRPSRRSSTDTRAFRATATHSSAKAHDTRASSI